MWSTLFILAGSLAAFIVCLDAAAKAIRNGHPFWIAWSILGAVINILFYLVTCANLAGLF